MASPTPLKPFGGGAIGSGEYAAQGMIAPMNPFVDTEGALTSVSFRFLHSLFTCIRSLETQVATLQQRIASAGIP